MAVDPRSLLPRHKRDFEGASAIMALGYPAVAPVLAELLEWLQDCNWPISHTIARFLASIGEPVIPHIRRVFAGTDGIWKYWCIGRLVRAFPRELAEELRPDLQRLAYHPTADDCSEEVHEQAREALQWLDANQEADSRATPEAGR
jgi:hypothetical protein